MPQEQHAQYKDHLYVSIVSEWKEPSAQQDCSDATLKHISTSPLARNFKKTDKVSGVVPRWSRHEPAFSRYYVFELPPWVYLLFLFTPEITHCPFIIFFTHYLQFAQGGFHLGNAFLFSAGDLLKAFIILTMRTDN